MYVVKVDSELYTFPSTLTAVLRGCVREYVSNSKKDDSCDSTVAIYHELYAPTPATKFVV